METYASHRPTAFDSHICSELDAFLIAPVSQTRDSGCLERSNWTVVTSAVLAVSTHEQTAIHRFGHWACGWYELLLIHPDDEAALREAEEFEAALENYPVADDEHLSALEWQEACDYWERASVRERVELCAAADISIFAARRDELPDDPTGALLQQLTA